jgi:transcription elongation factor GreA
MTEEKEKALLTKEGYEDLKKELQYREGELRKKLQDTLNQMRSQGDLSENDGYTMAVTDFQTNEDKILTIHETLENAVIVDKKKATKVDVGLHVTIECDKGNRKEYTIVGENETNPLESKISYKSPIGSSLMGKKKEDSVIIETPAGKTKCKIVEIQ